MASIKRVHAELSFIDLTHSIPTFQPSAKDPTKPDLSKPIANSKPIAGFYQQAVLYPADIWSTNEGEFASAAILIQEHNGTSFNSPNHYVNNAYSLEPGTVSQKERKSSEALTINQLSGKIVLIDVSARVRKELAKNGGIPHPDTSITDFSDNSNATVRAKDIESVTDQIEDGVWVVAHLGWSQLYGMGGEDWDAPGYVNGLNHPGFTKEAIDKLIEIMEIKGVTISGIAADNLSTDSGEGVKGSDNKWSNSWPAHVRLYQRDVLIVENLANLDALVAAHQSGECSLVVGALKHVGGTGGPARVVAVCDSN
ncbi:cyclase family protein [Acaryochloris marina]|uniref:cyclase family protein n=1 Tax=Acaryochloris marina TaxID=155978 RepID=UPI0021C36C9E|nr:cyclase family protein [Acaryochloris marina]BDM83673.1 cyclase [Acaryochloris marina MBIC10699]